MGFNYSSTARASELAAPVTQSATVLPVSSVTGFPAPPFTLVVDAAQESEEIVTVTGVAGLNLTVVRGEDGTAAVPHLTGAICRHAATGRDFRLMSQHMDANTGVHGLAAGAAVVGTSTAQALTNKVIDGGLNTVTNLPTTALANLSVATSKLADSGVTTAKVAPLAVTTPKIADANVTTPKIAPAAVTTALLADAGVTTAKIADANVTTGKLADEAVTSAKLEASLTRPVEFYSAAVPSANTSAVFTSGSLDTTIDIPQATYARRATVIARGRILFVDGQVRRSRFRNQINLNQASANSNVLSEVQYPVPAEEESPYMSDVLHVAHVTIPAGAGSGAGGVHLLRSWVWRTSGDASARVQDGSGVAMSVELRPI